MQKIVTIVIDIKKLITSKLSPFNVNEIEEINEHLELGWQIEEWDFLKEAEADGQVVLMAILNDDEMYENEEDDFDSEFNGDVDDYEAEEDSIKNKN